MTSNIGIGNKLNRTVGSSRALLFTQGELASLSHRSFSDSVSLIKERSDTEIVIPSPVGYTSSKELIEHSTTYTKEELIERFEHLAYITIPVNGIYQMCTIMEILLSDLIRQVIVSFPKKISAKRQVSIKEILASTSIEEVHILLTNNLLNELAYKSPQEFALEAESYLSLKLLECTAYHSYIEMKATRDILIHNAGIANDIYIAKAGTHARARSGECLPITQQYFLEVYESCLQLTEWLETQLHEKWYSSEWELRQQSKEAKTVEN